MPTTARGAFPYPAGADNWKMVRAAIQALADRAAAATVLWRQTTAAARGNAGAAGTLHHSSDTGAVGLDTGTTWLGLLTEAGGLITTAANKVGLSVRGAANQTVNLAEFRTNDGVLRSAVAANGLIAGHLAASTTATAGTSGAAALPATPQGYMHFWDQDNQRVMKVPYYLP